MFKWYYALYKNIILKNAIYIAKNAIKVLKYKIRYLLINIFLSKYEKNIAGKYKMWHNDK